MQDPQEAMFADMPANAIAHVAVDAIVPSTRVASTIAAMVRGEDPPPEAGPEDPTPAPSEGAEVALVCPECGGVLSERATAGLLQWECRVGHRYSPEALIVRQALGRAARSALRKVTDDEEDQRLREQEGAA